ncbi:MAG: hypothetical protein SV062_07025, partial [Thermodesulfobacteriota bacterium]|nr:hypothetical protein [Thermodesulfobacteriota bacterium]
MNSFSSYKDSKKLSSSEFQIWDIIVKTREKYLKDDRPFSPFTLPKDGDYKKLAKANKILLAEEEAKIILNEATKRAEAIEKDAYSNGFSQGEKAGMEISQKKIEPIMARLNQTILELD